MQTLPAGERLSPLDRVYALMQHERSDLWVVLAYAVCVGLLSLAVPVATASLVNSIAFGTLLQPVVVLTFVVFVVLCFEGLMRGMQVWVVEVLQRRVLVQVALELARRLPRVLPSAFDRANGPELVNRFFEVLTIQKTAATLLLDGLAVLLQALIGTVLLAFYHPVLLAFDVVLVLGIFIVLFPLGRGAIDTSIQESRAKYSIAAWLEELARLPRTFRDAGATELAVRRADALSQTYVRARAEHFRVVLRQHVGSFAFKATMSAALLGLGGWLVIQRGLSLGQLVAAELVVTAVVAGMTKLAKQLESWYDLVTAVDKLGHLTDLPLEREGGEPVPSGSSRGASLSLRGLSFSYEHGPEVLTEAELVLRPGERVAVLARSGNGKSALADLIVGLRSPRAGSIQIEGADLRELSLESVRAAVAVVRGAEVFEGTVADNVIVGRAGVTFDRARASLLSVGLGDEVAALPDGASTSLHFSGAPLSESQARRLMFARAIAGRPRLIIVDGALDAFDDETAAEMLALLTPAEAPWTLLVLTHRAEFARRCGRVLRLRGGALTPTE